MGRIIAIKKPQNDRKYDLWLIYCRQVYDLCLSDCWLYRKNKIEAEAVSCFDKGLYIYYTSKILYRKHLRKEDRFA